MFKTPNNIKKINILGTDVPIVISSWKCEKHEADGLYDYGRIYLRESYESVEEYKRILIHECFHALCEELGCQLDHHLEETLAHRVSLMVLEVLKVHLL